ncbi:MAG: metalloregulator ArsR/SmtB family transcription factor [Pseudomonadales bacterium]
MNQDDAIAALSALSQDTRLSVFRMLVRAGPDGCAAGAIADALGVRQNTLSTHLGILLSGGLARRRRDGRTIYYSADFDGMRALLTYLLEDCCGGDRSICEPLLEFVC